MPGLLHRLMGLGGMPDDMIRDEIAIGLKFRDAASIRDDISDNLAHLTQKAGALLAAQAIFIVVDTWGTEHGWSKYLVLVSVVLLIVAALIVLTLLRSIYLPAPRTEVPADYAFEDIFNTARVLSARGLRFNIALYMTFLSVILLGVGAVQAALGLG